MPTFRHFVALGVGAAIAFSFMEPGASKGLPLLIQPRRNPAGNWDGERAVAPIPKHLTAPVETPQKVGALAGEGNAPASATDDSGGGSLPLVTEQPEVGLPAANNGQTEVIVAADSTAALDAAELDRSKPLSPTATASVETNESKTIVTPTPNIAKPAEAAISSPILTLSGAVTRNARGLEDAPKLEPPPPETRQNVSKPVEDDTGKPIQPLSRTQIVQSSPSGVAQLPSSDRRDPPAPEFLNPSANPLLFPTQSQEVQIQGTQPITLQQAIELARRNNRQLQEAQLNLNRTQAALQEALAAEFPTASFNADFTRSESASNRLSNPNVPISQNPVSTTFNGSLQINYDLFTAGRRPALIRAAEGQVRFQQLEVERLSEQLRLDTTRSYYDLQQADAQVEISQAAVTDAAQSLRDAALREQAGLGTRFEVLQAQVQLANANQDLTRAISQQRISRRTIVRTLNLAQPVDVSAADPIEVAGEWTTSLEQSIVLAFKNRAELEQQLVQRDISEQQRLAERAATRPQAGLTARYDLVGSLDDDRGPRQGFSLGANLRWEFFNGGATRARVEQQRINTRIAETRFADQRSQVRLDVEQAFFDLNANRENIQTASFALVQAEESLRLARLRFQAGVGTQTDVINQQTALTQARGNRLRAILDYNRALAALERAITNLPASNLFDLP